MLFVSTKSEDSDHYRFILNDNKITHYNKYILHKVLGITKKLLFKYVQFHVVL